MKKLHYILLVFCLTLSSFNVKAYAEEIAPNTVTVSPAFQEIEILENESSVSKTITVTNTGQQTISLEVLPSTVNQQDLFGGISFENFSGAANETFPFLKFSVDRFVIEPQQSQEITITLENRSSLKPGGTYVAVVFRSTLDEPATEQVILPAISSLLLINKQGGATYNLSLKEVSGLPSFISFFIPSQLALTFSNNGNTHLQPRGSITFKGIFNRVLAQSTINESSAYILPGRDRKIQQAIKPSLKRLPFDIISVEIKGTGGERRTPYYFESSFIYIAPWFLAICVAITLFIILSTRIKKMNLNKHE